MVEKDELDILRTATVPAPRAEARATALRAAVESFDAKNTSTGAQESAAPLRLTERARKLWRDMMQHKLLATPALATLVALPIAGYAAFTLMDGNPFGFERKGEDFAESSGKGAALSPVQKPAEVAVERRDQLPPPSPERMKNDADQAAGEVAQMPAASEAETIAGGRSEAARGAMADQLSSAPAAPRAVLNNPTRLSRQAAKQSGPMPAPAPADILLQPEANRDRVEEFKTNPVHSTAEDPVSTFSIDVDTASYSFARRSLKEGVLPQADTVRVEEMINYFPYDWKGPHSAETPFNTDVSVMPSPWNQNTKLMHVAIKGYDVQPAEQPKANLVFLLDVSGSMNEPDKLPLLQSAFRLLVNKLRPDDTVSIVTYAGDAGTVLEPTKASERERILQAIDTLAPGGSTAGEAGIREAYRLAQKSFVKDGVNRVMLATDGDFNVGQTDDQDLKRIIEEKRRSGVFLSVFGFGRGNLNDTMMQAIAQNGNGTAAYIDTLQEAEKVLVEDASSTLFPIAKDVKIQVEFNPAKVSEYRLIGYETRALAREDFNNDRVDAGEIGSGHSVTAIYEITPKGSGGEMIDSLRYGEASTSNGGVANADEYAFVKIRYKAPDGDVSKLITTPVTSANEAPSFDAASADQRFSVAVAAFGQKLRGADQTADMGWERITEIATAARGTDPFGYRSEFLSLVRLAAALDTGGR
ncbi:VWA domain-containing protein [Arvimicrobium flavum]|uniref:VWA domain-containing protein n=1 Tax=Arvimicrobium flavum TaxID=3393320 RepID=UPI00237A8EF6|nr:VWA domain-containing protein [Mesorhizobium shangrilense]